MSQNEPIRVLLVDDHDMVRKGLGVFLRVKADLTLVGEAANGREAIRRCQELQPDVVLMDLLMPEMDGAAATREIRRRWPQIQVLALTSFQEKDLIRDVLDAGAIGYLLKNVSVEELATAIRSARAGQSILAPEAMQSLLRPAEEAPAAEDFELTPREMEVLVLLVDGLNNPEIADRLTVTRSTVKAHVSSILAKLGAANRAEAVAMALREGLVS